MNIQLTLALRYLGGRKLRTALTTLAVVFGVLVIFGLNALLPSFVNVLQANLMSASGHIDAVVTLKTSDVFPAEVNTQIAAVDGVRTVAGYLNRTINIPADYFDQDPGKPDPVSAVSLVGLDPEEATAMHVFMVQEGRFLLEGEAGATVITESLADSLGLGIGDVLTLPSAAGLAELEIVGLLPPRLQAGSEEVLVTLPQAQQMFAMQGRINSIEVNFDTLDEAQRSQIQADILDRLGEAYQVGALEVNSEIMTNLQVGQIVINMLGVLAVLMGGFIIFNTFRTLVAERRRDIGMLRALGATRRTVMGVILVEALVQGVIGTAAGLLLGYLCAHLMLLALNPIMVEFFNTSITTLTFSPLLLAGSIAMGLGVTLLAGWLPARSASRVTPLEALRPVVGAVSLRQMAGLGFWAGVVMIALAVAALLTRSTALLGLGGVLFIAGLILVAPGLVNPIAALFGRLLALIYARSGTSHLAQGNIARQPDRSAVTASTTLIGMAILVMAAAMVSSITIGMERVMRKNLGSDFILIPPSISLWGTNVGAGGDLVESLRDVEGVEVVTSLRFAPSRIDDLSISVLAIDPATYPQASGLDFSSGDEDEAYASLNRGRFAVANGILASTAGIDVGDQVELMTPGGAQTYTISAIGGDMINLKIATLYISHASLADDFQRSEDMLIQANLTDQADPQVAEAAFKEILQAYPQFRLVNGAAYIDEILTLLNAAFASMIGLVIFLSIPSLIAMVNTLAISVLERTREIGMLRAVGATRAQVRKMITAEALILAGLGTVFGILAGLYLGYMAISSLEAMGFPMEFAFPAYGVLLAFAGSILLGVVAAIIPARQASRLEIVEALRYE